MNCGTCKFWEYRPEGDDEDGFCRKRSPQALAVRHDKCQAYVGVWPLVYIDDWCGEWVKRRQD